MKKRVKITNEEIKTLLGAEPVEFPKYATQIINLANQDAQGTRPAVVGQMSELIQEFTGKTLEEWEEWYLQQHPDAIEKATQKISEMIQNFRDVIKKIDEGMIKRWVRDLVVVKTFIGLRFQEAILSKVANIINRPYRLATMEEESKGIDGLVGDIPVSIKPETYKAKKGLNENIDVKIIYYIKVKDGITIDIEEIIE
ncbi:MjaI restriction endonuclease [bacterium BMS3Abin07]|nr:MjaI restriction endonuclease [bacterium BMS3Abin07]HDL02009.1 MjaI family restriction endonuclease [candidate division Zixibacteria bacterium]